ncbi:MAG TPA: hypothetical protein VKK79_00520, partial [Candidatus Lokiarchaeia archaeon]|nr:hypothetical protein [Candidatus Lokiarchaeia archaeon]
MIAKAKICAMLAVALFSVALGSAWVPAANNGACANPPALAPVAADTSIVSKIAISQTQFNYNFYNENDTGGVISMYYGAPATIIAQYLNTTSIPTGIDPFSDPSYGTFHSDFNFTINMSSLVGYSFFQTIPLVYTGTPGDGVGNYTLPSYSPLILPVGLYTASVNFSINGTNPTWRPFAIAVLPCPDAIVLNNVMQNGTKLTQNPQGDFTTIDNASTITVTCTVTNALNGTALADEPVLTNSTAGNVTVTG